MPDTQYVAVKALRLGDRTYQPGERIPTWPGRSYHQMLTLGQIRALDEFADGPDGTLLLPLLPDSEALFVDAEGTGTLVVFLGTQLPDEEARAALELPEGQLAALVQFPDDADGLLVPIVSLLPGEPTGRLLRTLETRHQASLQDAIHAGEQAVQAAQEELGDLRLILKAVQTPGAPLPDDQVGRAELLLGGITTREGLQLVVGSPRAVPLLGRLPGLNKKLVTGILAAPKPGEDVQGGPAEGAPPATPETGPA